MSNEAQISFTGNLTADPELRFTPSGAAVANFTVAVTPRVKVQDQWEDGDTAFYRCAVWRDYAENVAESLTKGQRVVVVGRLKPRSYETRDGTSGLSLDVEVDEVGPSLRFGSAQFTRSQGQGGGQQRRGGSGTGNRTQQQSGGSQRRPQPSSDPWAAGPSSDPWASPQANQYQGDPWSGGGNSGGYQQEPPF